MSHDRYIIQWVGYCEFENKIWGHFVYKDPSQGLEPKYIMKTTYAFWAKINKTPSFKRHIFSKWDMDRMVKKKISNRYVPISTEELEKMWSNFYNDLDSRFIFHLLADNL